MTPQEVIDILKMFTTDKFQRCTSSEFDDAIYVAIEALETFTHSCEDCKHADYVPSANMVHCLEHRCVMENDNWCRDWGNDDD